MNRSTFLKTLSLSAAAAFCNNPLWRTPSFALPAPEPPRDLFPKLSLPAVLSGDVLRRILIDPYTEGFVRDAVLPWDDHKIDPRARYHCALESRLFDVEEKMTDGDAHIFFGNVYYILADFIRSRHSVGVGTPLMSYTDPFPVKRRRDGTRISPFISVATTTGMRMEFNPEYESAPSVEGIPFPMAVKYGCMIEVKAAVIWPPEGYDGEWRGPLGWCARAILCMGAMA